MRRFLMVIAAVMLGAVSVAQAQVPGNLPPDVKSTSPGGVDLRTGIYDYEEEDLSIGSPAAGGFRVVRMPWTGPKNSVRTVTTNWNYSITRVRGPDNYGYFYTINNRAIGKTFFSGDFQNFQLKSLTGGRGEKMERFGSGSGAYLVYTSSDNVRFRFLPSATGESEIAEIAYPTGIVYSFSYSSTNMRVASTTGYALVMQRDSSKRPTQACVFNTIVTPSGGYSCPGGVQTVSYGYASNGTLASVTDAAGGVTSFTNSFVNRATAYDESVTRPGQSQPSVTVHYATDPTCGIAAGAKTQTFADGRTIDYQWDMAGRGECAMGTVPLMFGWTENPGDAAAATTSLGWDSLQNDASVPPAVTPTPTSITDPNSRTSTTTYDGAYQNVVQTKLPSGLTVDYGYYLDNVTSRQETAVPGSGDGQLQVGWTYDCTYQVNCAKPTSRTDANGNVTDYAYDPTHGGIVSETAPAPSPGAARPQTRTTYAQYTANGGGGAIWLPSSISRCLTGSSCAGTADEVRTSFTYDASRNLLPASRTEASGDGSQSRTVTWTYDASGNKLSEDGPLPGADDTSYWRYDARRRVTGTILPDPDGGDALGRPATRTTYDVGGRVSRVETGEIGSVPDASIPPSQWSGFTVWRRVDTAYDALDRKTSETQVGSDGSAYALTQYSYDRFGRALCTAVRMNPAAFGAQGDACALGPEGSNGPDRIMRNGYDRAGQLTSVRNAVGTALEQVSAAYEYSADGQRTSLTDARGYRAEMEYDGHDRQKIWRFPPSVGDNGLPTNYYEQYGYDANGNRTSVRHRDGRVLTYRYDGLDRVTAKLVPDGCAPIQQGACPAAAATRDVYYGYDLRGLQLYARFDTDTGEGITNVYDVFGRQVSTTSVLDGVSRTVSHGFDLADNRTQVTMPGGTWRYGYDVLDRLTGLYEGDGSALSIWKYDARGLPASVAERYGSGVAWRYDALGRLAEQRDTFAGGSGNVVRTYAYNAASEVTSESRDNDAYAFTGYENVDRAYVTNALNQYTSAGSVSFDHDANGNLIASGTTGYGYDAENRLVSMSNGTMLTYDPLGRLVGLAGPLGQRQFVYDGDERVADYYDAATQKQRYVHGPGADDPLVGYDGDGVSRWFHRDRQGSIVAVAQGPSGAASGVTGYDEYGIPNAGPGEAFRYTGQAYIPWLGLYYYKARMYSPTLGRFMQTDPIGYDDQINLYAYVGNDPVNGTDPSGLGTPCGPKLMDICVTGPSGGNGKLTTAAGTKQKQPVAPLVRFVPENPKQPDRPSRTQCALQALNNNKLSLALDAGAAALTFLAPEASVAASIAGSALGVIGIGNAVANKDATGAGIAYAGKQAAVSGGFVTAGSNAARIVGRLNIGVLAASVLYDSAAVARDYNNCLAGR